MPRTRTVKVIECPKCGGDMTQIRDLGMLGYVDAEWDLADMVKRFDWFICRKCKVYERENMSISSRAFRFLGSSWEKLKEIDKIEE